MTAAGIAAVAGPETGDHDLATDPLIDTAFRLLGTRHLAHENTWRGKQIVDVPVHLLVTR